MDPNTRKALPGAARWLAVGAGVLFLSACGSSSKSDGPSYGGAASTPASTSAPASAPVTANPKIGIVSFKYSPPAITVKAGATITVDNKDTAAHTITADDNTSFDSGTLKVGETKSFTVAKAGTFKYHCAFHPFMHGELTVQ